MEKIRFLPLVAFVLAGCSSPPKAVVVNVQEPLDPPKACRSPERQRDLWIAPQANDNTLEHEQVITFVEKPAAWKLPPTIEPNAVPNPELPIQEGDYDDSVLEHQRQLLENEKKKSAQLENQVTEIQGNTQKQLKEKDVQLQEFQKQQAETNAKLQEVAAQLDQERKARENREAREKAEKEKSWWERLKFW